MPQAALRAEWCPVCEAERAFRKTRCLTCKQKVPGHSKYGNVPERVDGRLFQSRKEAARYVELRWLEFHGHIKELACQPRLDLSVNGYHICFAIPDFTYLDGATGARRYEDVKSSATRTPLFVLKKRLALAVLGIDICEV